MSQTQPPASDATAPANHTWTGEPRQLQVSLGYNTATLQATAMVRDTQDTTHAWLLPPDEALTVANLLAHCARAALSINQVITDMHASGHPHEQLQQTLTTLLDDWATTIATQTATTSATDQGAQP